MVPTRALESVRRNQHSYCMSLVEFMEHSSTRGGPHTSCVLCLVAQSCPTLCNPMDCSAPGSSVHGIFQARALEWVAIPFSRDLPDPGIEPKSPALLADTLPSEPPGKLYSRTLLFIHPIYNISNLHLLIPNPNLSPTPDPDPGNHSGFCISVSVFLFHGCAHLCPIHI